MRLTRAHLSLHHLVLGIGMPKDICERGRYYLTFFVVVVVGRPLEFKANTWKEQDDQQFSLIVLPFSFHFPTLSLSLSHPCCLPAAIPTLWLLRRNGNDWWAIWSIADIWKTALRCFWFCWIIMYIKEIWVSFSHWIKWRDHSGLTWVPWWH